jgi:CRISPR-associated protein Cmr3
MKPILLDPTDVLFFRDGRPMSGSLAGHGAAWPMPHVISHAFHAALHRADLAGVHAHRRGRSGSYSDTRDRKFGSLTTAGPFPVYAGGVVPIWYFPRPLDADGNGVSLQPYRSDHAASNLPKPLLHPVASVVPPSKKEVKRWWSEGAWNAYLGRSQRTALDPHSSFKTDADFAATEHSCGIGLAADTGSVVEGQFYSASYLRLKDGWKLGVTATAPDKDFRTADGDNDLVSTLLHGEGGHILVGGQQRVCSVARDAAAGGRLPLPLGMGAGFNEDQGRHLVKWVLLAPALYPQINEHRGGWLPSWVDPQSGEVMLLDGPGANAARRRGGAAPGKPIQARLVAAITGKPVPVTGWALPNGTDRFQGGAKSTHLAVPAGSVYYFECADARAAVALATALNWHGPAEGSSIVNRRSTLLGEKGFGLGVCGSWAYHPV